MEIDSAVELALGEVLQSASGLLSQRRPVPDEDIAVLCLDEAMSELTQNVAVVLDDLVWSSGQGADADDALRRAIEVQVDFLIGSAEENAWLLLQELFASQAVLPPRALVNRLTGVFRVLREAIASVVDSAVTPPSSPSSSYSSESPSWEGNDGVVLPLARRRRRGPPS